MEITMKNWIKNNIEVLIFWLIIGYYIPTIYYNAFDNKVGVNIDDKFNPFFDEYQEIKVLKHDNKRIIIRTNPYD